MGLKILAALVALLAFPPAALAQCPGGNCGGDRVAYSQPQPVAYQQPVVYRQNRVVREYLPYSQPSVRVQAEVRVQAPAYAPPPARVQVQVQRAPGPSWGYSGPGDLAYHVRNHHGIDTTGMSPAEVQAAHDNAHNSGQGSRARSSNARPFFRLFRR